MAPVVRLDYFMVGEDVAPAVRSCSIATLSSSLMTTASDHLPLVTVLDTGDPEAATDPIAAGLQTSARPGLEREGKPGLEDVDGPIGDASPPPT